MLAAAQIAEVVRLYGLRMWVEQSYKQTKHALGWSDYQVRSDLAIRRHWQLVCCAFSFCWYNHARLPADQSLPQLEPAQRSSKEESVNPVTTEVTGRGENRLQAGKAQRVVAGGSQTGQGVAGAVDNAVAILERVVESAPTSPVASAA